MFNRRKKEKVSQMEIGVARDITDLKKAKEAIKAERERLYLALDSVNVFIVIEDRDFNIQFENKSLREAFGGKIGQKCYKSYIGRETPCDVCPIKEILYGNKTEFTYYTEAAGRIFESHATKFKNPDGSSSIIEVLTDVTKRNRMEKELKKRIAELEKFTEVAVGREERIIELKKEVTNLKEKIRDLEKK